jgi:hypothetical protein
MSISPNLVSAQPNAMPEWVTKIIQYWSNGSIDDTEFFYAMDFLVNDNIIEKNSFQNQLVKIQKTSDESTFMPTKNYRLFVDSLPKDSELDNAVVNDAISFWKKNNVNFTLVDDQHMANIKISWIKEMDGPNDGYLVKDRIEIGLGTSIDDKWHQYDENKISFLLKHELGHFLGCPHSIDPQSIMYPNYNEYTKYDKLSVC